MRGLVGPLTVAAARARRSRSWILPTLALAVVLGFTGALASESVIVGDQSARAMLREVGPINRAVRLIRQGPLTSSATRTADRALSRLGVRRPMVVLLMNAVRLSDTIVRPVAIAPLRSWLSSDAVRRLGPCRALDCPVLVGSPGRVPPTLAAAGVRMRVVGRVALSSVPIGYSPRALGNTPILVTRDVAGLGAIGGLSGVFRSYIWLGLLPLDQLHSWSLSSFESRLKAAQASISPLSTQFTLQAPFSGLDAARTRASVAVHRLLLVDGGVLVAVVLFVLLAARALRRDQVAEIERLRHAGGRTAHAAAFVLAEAAWISAAAILAGLGLGVVFTIILAGGAGEPVGGVLGHGLLSWRAAAVLAGGWAATTALLAVGSLVEGRRIVDAAALAGGAVLVAGLALGAGSASAWVGLLVPLVCLSAGLVLFRGAGFVLRAAERIARRASLTVRLALVGLGRARDTAGLAIAFLAISTALAGFGLSFRATLIRGAADQAADRVPLDAVVSAGSSLASPLQLAPLARWRALSHARVFSVRRTQADYAAGGGTVNVPMLGVPAAVLQRMHGWRDSDAPAPLGALAEALRPAGPARTPGRLLPPATRWVGVAVRSPALDLAVTLDLRNGNGTVDRVDLGTTGLNPRVVRARVPPGHWQVEAVELSELNGTAITNGHQNGENPAPATQFSARLKLGPLLGRDASGHLLLRARLGGWRAVGAASGGGVPATGQSAETAVSFQTTGWPGVVRPRQPSDSRAVPVLVDPGTAAAAGPGGRLGLTVDGAPVQAHVVGVLRRFPTIDPAAAGFVVADQALLSGALDAWLPGQGQPDELWMATSSTRALRAALRTPALAQLSGAFRTDVDRRLRSDPVASGVMRTLLASGAVATLLALVGMLLVLAGPLRDPRIRADLEAQGVGPSGLRRELRVRFGIACVLGIWPGLLIALLLDRLTVAAVGAYESGASHPPLVTVVPVVALIGLGVGLTALCLAFGWGLSELLMPRRAWGGRLRGTPRRPGMDELAKELVR